MMTRDDEKKAIAELRERMLGIGVAFGSVAGALIARNLPEATTTQLVLSLGALGLWHIGMVGALAWRVWRATR